MQILKPKRYYRSRIHARNTYVGTYIFYQLQAYHEDGTTRWHIDWRELSQGQSLLDNHGSHVHWKSKLRKKRKRKRYTLRRYIGYI
ncbi:hypothetical protein PRUPE_1G130800 [Prunus persica]|uniref:Uncharacterized protein n=1 Tax=Prunus persica TaxID=3760 RepID=A0A251QWX1_PRUPE|nr:hypothetical protein PRUPE_1G130800 [Prunus persica]